MTNVEVLKREKECVQRKTNTNCSDCLHCDLLMESAVILSAYDHAISALQAQRAHPPCYLEEKNNQHPLCVGRNMSACAHCCLWADYDPDEDEKRINRPLTLEQLRQLDGEPVYVKRIKLDSTIEGFWTIVWIYDKNLLVPRRDKRINGDKFLGLPLELYENSWIAYFQKPEGLT